MCRANLTIGRIFRIRVTAEVHVGTTIASLGRPVASPRGGAKSVLHVISRAVPCLLVLPGKNTTVRKSQRPSAITHDPPCGEKLLLSENGVKVSTTGNRACALMRKQFDALTSSQGQRSWAAGRMFECLAMTVRSRRGFAMKGKRAKNSARAKIRPRRLDMPLWSGHNRNLRLLGCQSALGHRLYHACCAPIGSAAASATSLESTLAQSGIRRRLSALGRGDAGYGGSGGFGKRVVQAKGETE